MVLAWMWGVLVSILVLAVSSYKVMLTCREDFVWMTPDRDSVIKEQMVLVTLYSTAV